MKTIYLSAGHSNTDPGACAHGRREADIAVEFRNMVGFYLLRDGMQVGMDGEGNDNRPLAEAVKQAARYDIAVEFHCNAAAANSATGVECLSSPKDALLSARLCAVVSEQLGLRNRGAKPENAGQHHRLAFVQAGGLILELLFITNAGDLKAYDERKWLAAREVARVLAAEAQ